MTDNFLIDTNAVLLALQGNEKLAQLLQKKNPYLSFISEIELFFLSFDKGLQKVKELNFIHVQ